MGLNLFSLGAKKTETVPTAPVSPVASPEKKPRAPLSAIKDTSNAASIQDVLAPSAIEVDFSFIKIDDNYIRTIFVTGYPRYVSANWLAPLINFNHSLDVGVNFGFHLGQTASEIV